MLVLFTLWGRWAPSCHVNHKYTNMNIYNLRGKDGYLYSYYVNLKYANLGSTWYMELIGIGLVFDPLFLPTVTRLEACYVYNF